MKSFLLLGLALVVVLPSSAKDHPALSMKVFTSSDDEFWVNSTIIEGTHEVMLVENHREFCRGGSNQQGLPGEN